MRRYTELTGAVEKNKRSRCQLQSQDCGGEVCPQDKMLNEDADKEEVLIN